MNPDKLDIAALCEVTAKAAEYLDTLEAALVCADADMLIAKMQSPGSVAEMLRQAVSGTGVEPEPFGHETGEPWKVRPTALSLAAAIAELATEDRSGLIQRVRGLILRDRATERAKTDALRAERDALQHEVAEQRALVLCERDEWAASVEAYNRLSAERDALKASTAELSDAVAQNAANTVEALSNLRDMTAERDALKTERDDLRRQCDEHIPAFQAYRDSRDAELAALRAQRDTMREALENKIAEAETHCAKHAPMGGINYMSWYGRLVGLKDALAALSPNPETTL